MSNEVIVSKRLRLACPVRRRYEHDCGTRPTTALFTAAAVLAVVLSEGVTKAFRVSAPRPVPSAVVPHHSARTATARSIVPKDGYSPNATRHNHARHAAVAKKAEPSPAFLQEAVFDLRKRILDAPEDLPGNDEAQRRAETFLARSNRFEIDGDGKVVGGTEKEIQLADALARETVVVMRVTSADSMQSLAKLGTAAEELLGESRTVEEKEHTFGRMQHYDGGVVAGYVGGADYGDDQYLETRGSGAGAIVPAVGGSTSADVIEGRRLLSTITSTVLRAVVRHHLPGVDPAVFLELVDSGEGEGTDDRIGSESSHSRRLSSTPLRMCRYAGADGVAFGAHTDTTFLTVIPCASAPGLEVLQPSTGRWLRPEAAGDAEPGADVMLLAGELLQVLGRGSYQAAVHRVVRPAGLTEPRISTPLLVRGSANVAVPDSMLPAFVAIACAAIGAEVLPAARAMNTSAQAWQKITMKDLWAALQFRAEPSDETPLAHSRLGQEHEIRQIFGPFAPAGLNVLSLDPLLVRLHGFASAADCRTIIEKASASMAESKTWGSADEQDEASGVRKSSTAWVSDGSLPLLEVLTARVAVLSGLPSTFMEKWQVARYKPQGYFNLHTDHVDAFNRLCCGGRLSTLILYLNDDFEGGYTDFPSLGVSVQTLPQVIVEDSTTRRAPHLSLPREELTFACCREMTKPAIGDAIYFHSVKVPVERADAENMTADERSAHAGLPVESGEKWIATKWIHPLPYPHGREGPETWAEAGWPEKDLLGDALLS